MSVNFKCCVKAKNLRREAALRVEPLPGSSNTVIGDLLNQAPRLGERVKRYDTRIKAMDQGLSTADFSRRPR